MNQLLFFLLKARIGTCKEKELLIFIILTNMSPINISNGPINLRNHGKYEVNDCCTSFPRNHTNNPRDVKATIFPKVNNKICFQEIPFCRD